MEIYFHGNKGHSHSHAGCFPFLPIPIPNFVISSHSRGIPISIGNPIPMVISTKDHQPHTIMVAVWFKSGSMVSESTVCLKKMSYFVTVHIFDKY